MISWVGGGGIVHLPKLLCYNKVCGMVGAEKLLCPPFVIDTSSGVALWIISLLAALLYSASRAAPFVWPKGWKGAGDCNCVWWKGRKGEWRGNQIMKWATAGDRASIIDATAPLFVCLLWLWTKDLRRVDFREDIKSFICLRALSAPPPPTENETFLLMPSLLMLWIKGNAGMILLYIAGKKDG